MVDQEAIFLILIFIIFLSNILGRRRKRGYVSEFCSGKVDFFTMERGRGPLTKSVNAGCLQTGIWLDRYLEFQTFEENFRLLLHSVDREWWSDSLVVRKLLSDDWAAGMHGYGLGFSLPQSLGGREVCYKAQWKKRGLLAGETGQSSFQPLPAPLWLLPLMGWVEACWATWGMTYSLTVCEDFLEWDQGFPPL